jgi:hypothetical protein
MYLQLTDVMGMTSQAIIRAIVAELQITLALYTIPSFLPAAGWLIVLNQSLREDAHVSKLTSLGQDHAGHGREHRHHRSGSDLHQS